MLKLLKNACFVMILTVFSTSCTKDFAVMPIEGLSRPLSKSEKQLVKAGEQFGVDLFKKVHTAEPDQNIFISPLSVSMALGMTLNGAKGATADEMRATLTFGNLSEGEINKSYKSLIELLTSLDPKVQMEIANAIWYRQEFAVEKAFIDINKKYFNASVQGLDFNSSSAIETMNGWVRSQTHGKIPKIIDDIDPMIVMFLMNALYFKGTWTFEFKKEMTQEEPFYLTDGGQIPTKMMKQSNDFKYLATEDFEAVDLPYGNGAFAMAILVPHANKKIADFIHSLNGNDFTSWMNGFKKSAGTVVMPKFKLEYEKTLNQTLIDLGMPTAFTEQANFEKINADGNLYISEVKHKTFVDVNEEGTEAAAVTSVGIALTSVGRPTGFYLRADRPFLFVIHENHSQTILFMGKIMNPNG